SHILKLSDEFQMKDARAQSELFLTRTSKIPIGEKLMMADKYDLKDFVDNYLDGFSCAFKMRLQKSDFDKLSDKMKGAINDRMRKLLFDDNSPFNHRCWCILRDDNEDESMDSDVDGEDEEDSSDMD
ncbi:hypothetical protein PMAYCL1PPCAC_25683, partial [Pristionchus mayeri]